MSGYRFDPTDKGVNQGGPVTRTETEGFPRVEINIGANPHRSSVLKIDGVDMIRDVTRIAFEAKANEITTVVIEKAANIAMPEQEAAVVFRLIGLEAQMVDLTKRYYAEPDDQKARGFLAARAVLNWLATQAPGVQLGDVVADALTGASHLPPRRDTP